MNRPNKWVCDEKLVVDPSNYKMVCVHNYIKKILLQHTNEIEKIELVKGLHKIARFYGVCLFEKKKILVATEVSEQDFLISILHEIFHVYFHDDYDDRNIKINPSKDPVEKRVEKSARNMLKWYRKNKDKYYEFKYLISRLKKRKLTSKDLEELE
jgi:hypothetical protein